MSVTLSCYDQNYEITSAARKLAKRASLMPFYFSGLKIIKIFMYVLLFLNI